jgi:chemotaxis protein MotA
MTLIIGMIIVFCSVFVSYGTHGGNLEVLWQPVEVMIIGGAAIGAFIIGNSKITLMHSLKSFGEVVSNKQPSRQEYIDLICLLHQLFKLAKMKGFLAIESHIDYPHESNIFSQFPSVLKNHHAVVFMCDYFRLVTMGNEDAMQLETLMEKDIEVIAEEKHHVSHAFTQMADGMPALGIVAAVLGVIKTMGSITEPPEVLGKSIGAALVGTFLGVLIAYGLISPFANALIGLHDRQMKFYECIKVGMLAFLQGNPPAVSIEFSRKILPEDIQPTFAELEQVISTLPTPGV